VRRSSANRLLASLGVALLLALAAGSCGDGEQRRVRLFDGGWQSLQLNNAIASFLLVHGYDYEVELVPGSTRDLLEALPAGGVDLTLEGWQENALDWYQREIAAGRIVNLGPTYQEGRQFFIVPRWMADEFGIASVFDLRKHWELLADPRDASKGVIVSCVTGSRCAELNRAKLQAYGLDRHFNLLAPASYESLESTLSRALEIRLPIAGYYWSPTPLVASGDWVVLREPAHSTACHRALENAANSGAPATEGCGYPLATVDALARAGLERHAPEAVALVRRMDVGVDALTATLVWAEAEGLRDDWERAAIHYLSSNPTRWREWVTPGASERVQAALANLETRAR
jgi:glycine betaine/proline transport system substrate-binding protein